MQTLFLIVHVLLAIGLIGLILLQQGKGADAGAAFGSGASSTVFGARGSASFLSRTTAILATLFFVVSLALAMLASSDTRSRSLTELPPAPAPSVQPAETEAPVRDVPAAPVQSEGAVAPSDVPVLPKDGSEGGTGR